MIPVVVRLIACAVLGCSATAALGQTATAASAPAPLLVRSGDRLSVPATSPLRSRLEVATVAALASTHALALPAVVEADPARSVNIVPPLTGRVVALRVHLGDEVRRGQLLATLASPDLTQAVADAAKARDSLDLAQRALTRAEGVHETGSNAVKDVEAARSTLVQAVAERDRAESRLKALGARADGPTGQLLRLTAPFDGVVTALSVGQGAFLSDAAVSLMTIANLDRVWITVNVPENLLSTVAAGQPARATVAAYPERTFAGRIAFVAPILDADTRRASARIAFANPDHALKPNMYASATLALPQGALPEVPASALLMNNDQVSVFVETAPWTFVRRFVELGREDGDRVRIASGLRAGERVVVRGGVLLND